MTVEATPADAVESADNGELKPVKRGRGRPRKDPPGLNGAPVGAAPMPVPVGDPPVGDPPDDDDEDDEDDETDEEAEAAAKAIMEGRAPRPRPQNNFGAPSPVAKSLTDSRAELQVRRVKEELEIDDDLAEMQSNLDFGENKHEIVIARMRWCNAAGVLTSPTKGSSHLGTFQRPISTPEIRNLYGGGEFNITIWGPNPAGKRVLKAKRVITIEAESLFEGKPVASSSANADANMMMAKDLMRSAIDAKEREVMRLLEETKELKKAMMESLQKDPAVPFITLMKEQEQQRLLMSKDAADREDRRLDLQRTEKKEEDARREKMEAQRRIDDERRLEFEKERAKIDSQNIVAMMSKNTDVMLTTLKETMSSKESQYQNLIASVQAQAATQLSMVTANFNTQQQLAHEQMKNIVTQTHEMAATKEKMLMDALKEARTEKKSGLESVLTEVMHTQLKEKLLGSQGGIVDGLREIVSTPGAADIVRAFMGRPSGPQMTQPQLQGQPQPQGQSPGMQPVAMGVVQVSGPRRGPSPWPTTSGAPPRPKPKPKPPAVVPVVTVASIPSIPVPTAPPIPDAATIGVVFPGLDATLVDKTQALIVSVDTAIRADWSSEHIWLAIVSKFPPDLLKALKEERVEGCLKVIEEHAPQSVINTAHGVQIMRDVYEFLEKT